MQRFPGWLDVDVDVLLIFILPGAHLNETVRYTDRKKRPTERSLPSKPPTRTKLMLVLHALSTPCPLGLLQPYQPDAENTTQRKLNRESQIRGGERSGLRMQICYLGCGRVFGTRGVSSSHLLATYRSRILLPGLTNRPTNELYWVYRSSPRYVGSRNVHILYICIYFGY